jgi:tRNA modification GTPase
MKSPGHETIAAVATGAGGGIGIVRISGCDALAIAGRVFRGRGGRRLEQSAPFQLVLGAAHDPDSGEAIDEVLAVQMPAGRSYTGEPVVEIQCHGGRAVLESVVQAAYRGGARPAGPGEFTKRAFLSGRLDLAQAEAVAGLIGAEDEASRRAALRQLQGAVGLEVNQLRERLLDLVARVEAALDFEEGEIPDDLPAPSQIDALAGAIRRLAALAPAADGVARGVRVVLAGRANSGKSSIFNYLLSRSRSIVSAVPGTTRDYVEERSVLGGASVTLVDTAGIRPTADAVEAEGVRRSIDQIAAAGVVVLVLDGSEPNHPDDGLLFARTAGRAPLVLLSKGDLPVCLDRGILPPTAADLQVLTLSAVTGAGFPEFIAALTARCRAAIPADDVPAAALNSRHRQALERAGARLEAAAALARREGGVLDQVALEMQAALASLGEITGLHVTDEILERIFASFCVGK